MHGTPSIMHLGMAKINRYIYVVPLPTMKAHHTKSLCALPFPFNYLHVLRRALDLALPFHAAVWGVALVSVFGCHRLGEITIQNLSSFDLMFYVLHSSNPILHTLHDGTHSTDFHIPWTKSTREKGADVILTARYDRLVPLRCDLELIS
jgi:hypothetical protein